VVKHIVLWNFAPEVRAEDKVEVGERIRGLLEPIRELVPGAISIQVVYQRLDSGNRDVALISEFDSMEALQVYKEHPAHVEAGKYIRSVTCDRACMDFVVG
jgi:heme-degrading monooxygenase HmoA